MSRPASELSDRVVVGRLFALARPYRGWMLAAGIVAGVTILASVGLMAVAGGFIAAMAIAGVTTGMMNYFLPSAAIRLFAILRTGGRYLERVLSHEATFRLLSGLRLWLFRRLEPLAPAQLVDRRGADLAGSIQADVESLQHAYLRLGAPLVVALACGVFITGLLVLLHPPTGLAVAVLLACAGGIIPALARWAAEAPAAQAVHLRAEQRVAVVDALQGAGDLRAAGAVERRLQDIARRDGELVEAQRRAALSGTVAEASVGLCSGLAMWAAAVLAMAGLAAGQLAPPMVPALALAALASFEAVAPLPGAVQRWGEVRAAARRLLTLADREPAIADGPAPVPELEEHGLVFTAVRMRYAADTAPALDGLDLVVPSGGRVAILGPSGAGKSTIARLLLRFWEYEGEIRLGGRDLRGFRGEDLRRLVGVAGQEAQLFNGTIRDNLLLAAPSADAQSLERCLELAQLKGVVEGLPEGLDTWIGEAGARLSAGQARRLVLARTLLRHSPILVLDEPTENLDATTARRLLAGLAEALVGRTVILITHDPSAAALFAHEVVRLEEGRIVS